MSDLRTAEPICATLADESDFDGWRDQVRRLIHASVAPRDVDWTVGPPPAHLFGADRSARDLPAPVGHTGPRAPAHFEDLARQVVCHKSPDRFVLLHTILARLQGDKTLLSVASDADVARAQTMAKNVRRCSHKMKAFVRFRSTHDADGVERFVAWFEPEHHTLDRTAGFFVRRFAHMRWSILTPLRSAHYDGATLTLGGGASRDVAPNGDIHEDLWRTYFAAIFNPARLKINAMRSEMPKRYWKNMPEGDLVAPLIKLAVGRTEGMLHTPTRAPARSTRVARAIADTEHRRAALAIEVPSLDALAEAANACARCPLHGPATQAIPGEGPTQAAIMFVGEQPGDQEDLAGRPFIGPAGTLFDEALGEAAIERASTFITNAVKHFKFEPRGKRRLHKSPNASEVDHCRFWLNHERRLVQPRLTVALGATAVRALSGRTQRLGDIRGTPLRWPDGAAGFATVHPAAILRLPNATSKRHEYERFISDLREIKALAEAVGRDMDDHFDRARASPAG